MAGDEDEITTACVGSGALVALVALAPACSPAKPVATLSASELLVSGRLRGRPEGHVLRRPRDDDEGHARRSSTSHGMYAGHGSPEEWRLVRIRGQPRFAVVVPRGKRGLCAWKAELKDHFCWPQEPEDPQAFKNVIAEWDRVLWQVDAILEGGSHKRYVLGFSNGGFFASYLAEHGLFPAQAYAIVGGGPLEPAQKPGKAVPIMLLSAQDNAVQAPKTKELHEGLSKVGWAHAYCTRPGPHPLAVRGRRGGAPLLQARTDGTLKHPTATPARAARRRWRRRRAQELSATGRPGPRRKVRRIR